MLGVEFREEILGSGMSILAIQGREGGVESRRVKCKRVRCKELMMSYDVKCKGMQFRRMRNVEGVECRVTAF